MKTLFKTITKHVNKEITDNITKLTTVLSNIGELAQTNGKDKTGTTQKRAYKMRDRVYAHLGNQLVKFKQLEPSKLASELAPKQFLQGFHTDRVGHINTAIVDIDKSIVKQTEHMGSILDKAHLCLAAQNKPHSLEHMNSNLCQLNQYYETIYLKEMTKILTARLALFTSDSMNIEAKAFVNICAKDYSTSKISEFVERFHEQLETLLDIRDTSSKAYQQQLRIVNEMREQKASMEANDPWSIITGDQHLCQASTLAQTMLAKTPKEDTIESHKAFIMQALTTLPKIFSLVDEFSEQTAPKTLWKDTLSDIFTDSLSEGEREIKLISERFSSAFSKPLEFHNSQAPLVHTF